MSSRQQELNALIAPVVEAMGCDLWGIEYQSQGRRALLRIYIEKPDGVMLEDCEKVSRQVSSLLDVEDPILSQYTLEVSSPGMDRPLYTLAQYQQYIGEQIQVKLSRMFEKRKKIRGTLVGIEGDEIVVQVDDEQYLLPMEVIERANVVPTF